MAADGQGSAQSIRLATKNWGKTVGLEFPSGLPVLERVTVSRTTADTARRALALHLIVARAAGFDLAEATTWATATGILDWLSGQETEFFRSSAPWCAYSEAALESVWSLAWALGVYPVFDPLQDVAPDDLVDHMPDPFDEDSVSNWMKTVALRQAQDVAGMLDKLYCLNWAAVEAELQTQSAPLGLATHVIEGRRRAFEWLIGDESWDEVSRDT